MARSMFVPVAPASTVVGKTRKFQTDAARNATERWRSLRAKMAPISAVNSMGPPKKWRIKRNAAKSCRNTKNAAWWTARKPISSCFKSCYGEEITAWGRKWKRVRTILLSLTLFLHPFTHLGIFLTVFFRWDFFFLFEQEGKIIWVIVANIKGDLR